MRSHLTDTALHTTLHCTTIQHLMTWCISSHCTTPHHSVSYQVKSHISICFFLFCGSSLLHIEVHWEFAGVLTSHTSWLADSYSQWRTLTLRGSEVTWPIMKKMLERTLRCIRVTSEGFHSIPVTSQSWGCETVWHLCHGTHLLSIDMHGSEGVRGQDS